MRKEIAVVIGRELVQWWGVTSRWHKCACLTMDMQTYVPDMLAAAMRNGCLTW